MSNQVEHEAIAGVPSRLATSSVKTVGGGDWLGTTGAPCWRVRTPQSSRVPTAPASTALKTTALMAIPTWWGDAGSPEMEVGTAFPVPRSEFSVWRSVLLPEGCVILRHGEWGTGNEPR